MDWVVTEKELRFVSAFTICKKTKTKPKELSRFQLLVARFFIVLPQRLTLNASFSRFTF